MTLTEAEARAILRATGKDDTPADVQRLMEESTEPGTPEGDPEPPAGTVKPGPSGEAAAPAADGDAGTSPSPPEEAPPAPTGVVDYEAPLEPQGPPEAPAVPTATDAELEAAKALLGAAGYTVS